MGNTARPSARALRRQLQTSVARVARLEEALRLAREEEEAARKRATEAEAAEAEAAETEGTGARSAAKQVDGPPVLLGLADLRALGIPYSRQHLWRLIRREGRFPAPVALGPEPSARKAWRAADIERWLAALPYTNTTENEETAA